MSMNRLIAMAIASGLTASVGSAITGQNDLCSSTAIQPRLAPPATRRESRTRSVASLGYPSGPGWTAAQVKRMAKKRKNPIRNRKAHRG